MRTWCGGYYDEDRVYLGGSDGNDCDVRLVVLSIGGNDLGFGDILAACARAWTLSSRTNPDDCRDEQQPQVLARLPRAMAGLGQGELQESLHPNAYAQRALGRCLTLLYAARVPASSCRAASSPSLRLRIALRAERAGGVAPP